MFDLFFQLDPTTPQAEVTGTTSDESILSSETVCRVILWIAFTGVAGLGFIVLVFQTRFIIPTVHQFLQSR